MRMKLVTSLFPPLNYKANYDENFKDFPSSASSLLTTLLHLDSDARGTAASALQSQVSYFSLPCCFYEQFDQFYFIYLFIMNDLL